MRIAFFTETFLPKVDGIVTRLRNTISHLRRAGDEVLIFAPDGGGEDFEGARIVGMKAAPFPLYPELRLALPRRSMRRELEAFRPDLIHVVDPVLLGVAGIYYADKIHLPSIVSYHTQLPKYLRYYNLDALEGWAWKAMRFRHKKANLNVCTSAAMVEELTSHGIERVRLWQPGIDTELFHPTRATDAMRARLSEGHSGSPLLIYVGRLSPEKSLEEIKPILESIPEARLALVGGGPHRPALEKHFAGTKTYFAGYLQGAELASAFASADLFVMPSRTETLGLVLLEAMAAGCPVVARKAGGIPDLIEDGVTGLLFDDAAQSIAAVRHVLTDRVGRDRLRCAGRARAETWGWRAATEQVRGFYREAIEQGFQRATQPVSQLQEITKLSVMTVIKTALP